MPVIRVLRSRRFVHALALVMQLCMAWMSVSALVHSDDDDALCNPVVVLHDHAAHHIGSPSAADTPSPDHCFICHNLSLRSLVATTDVVSPVVVEQAFVQVVTTVADVTLASRRPARAPPLA